MEFIFYRAKEWLVICERPDLMRRVDIGDITINNYYVCETHFPNQILDYATRKILIKTAKPLSVAELKALPARHKGDPALKSRRQSDEYDAHIEQEFDDDEDYELEDSKGTTFRRSPFFFLYELNWGFILIFRWYKVPTFRC